MALTKKKFEDGLQRLGFARSERGVFHKVYGSGAFEVILSWDNKKPRLNLLKRPMRVPVGTPNPEPEIIIVSNTDLRPLLPPDCINDLSQVAKLGGRVRKKNI